MILLQLADTKVPKKIFGPHRRPQTLLTLSKYIISTLQQRAIYPTKEYTKSHKLPCVVTTSELHLDVILDCDVIFETTAAPPNVVSAPIIVQSDIDADSEPVQPAVSFDLDSNVVVTVVEEYDASNFAADELDLDISPEINDTVPVIDVDDNVEALALDDNNTASDAHPDFPTDIDPDDNSVGTILPRESDRQSHPEVPNTDVGIHCETPTAA